MTIELPLLNPRYMAEDRIVLALGEDQDAPAALRPVFVTVDYARTLPSGVVLPLILEVQGPSAQSYQRRVFWRALPADVVFVPTEGGRHLVLLREAAHNRWFGTLRVSVEGEKLDQRGAFQ